MAMRGRMLASCLMVMAIPRGTTLLTGAPALLLRARNPRLCSRAEHRAEGARRFVAQPCTRWPVLFAGTARLQMATLQSAASEGGEKGTQTFPPPAPLRVVYQDDHLAVLSKPGGMLMHRTKESSRETVFFLQLARDQLGKQVTSELKSDESILRC